MGQGPAGEPRPQQFRRDPLRVLPRRRTWPSRRSRPARSTCGVENISRNWATALRRARRVKDGRDHSATRSRHESAQPDAGLRLQPRGARCSRTAACARRSAMRSTSNGPTRTCSTGCYTRTDSYFSNSELAATGLPVARGAEAARAAARPDPRRGVHQEYKPPMTDGSGNNRDSAAPGDRRCSRRRAGRSRAAR